MHFGSYFTSLLLHALILLAVVFWPAPPPVRLDRPMLQISMNLGAPGGDKQLVPVLGHRGSAAPAEVVQRSAPPPPADAVAVPVPKVDDAKPQEEPRREAAAKPIPPKPEAVPIPERKTPEKVQEQLKPEEQKQIDKPEETEKPKPEKPKNTEKPEKTPKAPAEKKPSPQDVLNAALADARNRTGPVTTRKPARSSRGKSPVASVLSEFERAGGGGDEGKGPGGGGLYDVYLSQVITAIRSNWNMAIFSRENLVVDIWIKLSPEGEVLDCRVERSSGRPEFDGSAINAVLQTKFLPPPPSSEQQELIVGFNSQDAV